MPTTDLKPLGDLSPDVDAWDRQPRETVKRFSQFCAYRDLGRTRTLRRVAEQLGLNDRYVRSLSAAYRWVDRAEAFDRHRDRLDEQTWLEQRRRAAENDARLLDAVVGKIAQRLSTLQPADLEVPDVIRLVDVALRHRRALFGDPQMTVAVTGPSGDPLTVQLAEFAQMGTEQRRLAAAALVATVQRRTEAAAGVDDDDG